MNLSNRFLGILLVATLFVACTDTGETVVGVERQETTPPVGFSSFEAALQAELGDGPVTIDGLFVAAARLAPWFGGMYIKDGHVRMVTKEVNVSGASAFGLAIGLLEAAGKGQLAREVPGVTLVPGRFSFAELWGWRVSLSPRLKDLGVQFIDIDEVNNILDLRIAEPRGIGELDEWIKENHIPSEAVRITPFNIPVVNHSEYGGDTAKVRWGANDYWGCTLTQVVEHHLDDASVDTLLYGITNSHCTASFGINHHHQRWWFAGCD